MWLGAVKWRYEQKLDTCLDVPFEAAIEIRNLLDNQSEHGFDTFGRPIYIEYISRLDISRVSSKYKMEDMLKYQFHTTEFRRKFLFPRGSAISGKRADMLCSVLDLKGLSTKHLSREGYQFLKSLSSLSQAYYPELLGQLFVVNAPTLFAMAWAVISPWLHERTRAKIQIFKGSGKKELLKVIDEKDLPASLGGKCKCDGKNACIDGHAMNQLYFKVAKYGRDWETEGKGKDEKNSANTAATTNGSSANQQLQQQTATSSPVDVKTTAQQNSSVNVNNATSSNGNNSANSSSSASLMLSSTVSDSNGGLSSDELNQISADSNNKSNQENEAALRALTVADNDDDAPVKM
jgi:hypothetical protein